MTREEQIVKRAEEITSRFSYRNGYSTSKDAFIEGARWADANQPSPWISVEDRLPPRKDKDHPYSERVFVRYIERLVDQEYVRYSFDDLICVGKIKKWCRHETNNEHVTHWMPIPELKQQDIASEVIAYQQEDEEIKRLIDEYSEKFPQGGIGGPLQINKGEMILSKEECEKIRTAVLENKPEVVEEIVVDHAIEFISKKIQQ